MKTRPGIFIGRLSPLQLGHEAVIQRLIEAHGAQNVLILLGSVNTGYSDRTPFSYEERKELVHKIFPTIPVVGIPDYPDDPTWLKDVDTLIRAQGFNPDRAVFWGGTREDLRLFIEGNRPYVLVDRFSGTTPLVSATQVREALKNHTSLDGMVDPLIQPLVRKLYETNQAKLR